MYVEVTKVSHHTIRLFDLATDEPKLIGVLVEVTVASVVVDECELCEVVEQRRAA